MKIIYNILIFLLLSVTAAFCLEYGTGYKSSLEYFNNDLKVELEKRNIPFLINSEGAITYPQKHIDTVESIITELKNRPVSYIYDKEYLKLLETAFTNEGIPYTTRHISNSDEMHFFWAEENDSRAKKIVQLTKPELLKELERKSN